MLKNLLIYRFVLFNVAALVLVGVALERGIVQYIYAGDATGICYAITILFLVSWAVTARRVVFVSRGLNAQKRQTAAGAANPLPGSISRAREKFFVKMEWLSDMSNWMVGLGLIGTVVGFGIALSGVDQMGLSRVEGVQDSVVQLMVGMRIALNTTIAGSVLGMWNEINQRMLKTASTCLWLDYRASQ